MTLQELLKANSLNKYYGKVKGTTLVEAMFPAVYNNSFDINILNGVSGGAAKVVQYSQLDADPLVRDWGLKPHSKEGKKFFRERMSLNEEQRMTLLQVLNSKDETLIEGYTAQIYEQFAGRTGFLASVRALNTYMAAQFLSTGKVKLLADNGGGDEIDYKLSPELKETLTLTSRWDQTATADPLEDLRRWKETVDEKGGMVEIALMNQKTFNLIKSNPKVIQMINNQKLLLTAKNINYVIEQLTGLAVVIWKDKILSDGAAVNPFLDNVVTLIPNGELGKTEYGPTPTRTDKMFNLAGGRDIVDINGTFAPLEVESVSKASTVRNVDVVIEVMSAINPTIMNSMFIATVV